MRRVRVLSDDVNLMINSHLCRICRFVVPSSFFKINAQVTVSGNQSAAICWDRVFFDQFQDNVYHGLPGAERFFSATCSIENGTQTRIGLRELEFEGWV